MAHLTSKKKVQKLIGRIAALSYFISRSAEKYLPYFKILRHMMDFSWSDECRRAFDELKGYLGSPILLSIPSTWEILFMYLGISQEAISSILIQEDGKKVQRLIYYMSIILHDVETRYSWIEKIVYALIISAGRLWPYFQAYLVVILTDQPLKTLLQWPDILGRMAKWAIELEKFDISY